MPIVASARFALRDATSARHERVDATFATADLTSRDGYGRFLLAQAAAHVPAEKCLEEAGIARVLPDWPARRRSDLILRDLDALGLQLPVLEVEPALTGVPELLGAVYVLEGSRLGGAVLKRSVPAVLPTAFLSTGGSAAWRELIALLDERLSTPEEMNAAITAACGVFEMFERSGRRFFG